MITNGDAVTYMYRRNTPSFLSQTDLFRYYYMYMQSPMYWHSLTFITSVVMDDSENVKVVEVINSMLLYLFWLTLCVAKDNYN